MLAQLLRRMASCLIVMVLLLVGCAQPPPNNSGLQAVTAIPTIDTHDPASLCQAVSRQWGRDWPTVIRALEALYETDSVCEDGLALPNRLYAAYMAYGTLLEQRGRLDEAVAAYQSALDYNRIGAEAASRLRALSVYTPEPPPRCPADEVLHALSAVPAYTPTSGSYVRIQGSSLTRNGQPYTVYGISYYPRDTPGRRFLTETDVESAAFELDILQAAGINTLRIYLRNDLLFTCPGDGPVPIAQNLARLDAFIHSAGQRGLKLILVLNHAADLSVYPLYENPPHSAQQTLFLVNRYRNEPTIMAWDLRDSGDLDYLSEVAGEGRFPREVVLNWLIEMTAAIRQTDSNHLITAGWRSDVEATLPIVDFASFHHTGDSEALRRKIADLQSKTHKPILLAQVGYSTYDDQDETAQRDQLFRVFEAVQRTRLAGWVVWTAFDFPRNVTCEEPPDCVSEDSEEHHFGLWNTSYFPKLAVQAVKQITGAE